MKKTILLIFMTFGLQPVFGTKGDTSLLNKLNKLEIKLINNQTSISELRKRNDSLENSLTEIKINDYKSFEVIDSVNTYYDNAWNKLIYLITALGGIIVFVIPLILSRLQRKELRLNKEDFQEYVDKKIIEFEKTIKDHNDGKIKEFGIEMEKNHKLEIAKLYGMTYHLQGREFIMLKNYPVAATNFIKSIRKQIEACDTKNFTTSLNQIVSSPKMDCSKVDFF